MIHVTRLDGAPIVINGDLIETIEATPDTLLSLTTGRKLLVRENVAVVVQRALDFKRAAMGRVPGPPAAPGGEA